MAMNQSSASHDVEEVCAQACRRSFTDLTATSSGAKMGVQFRQQAPRYALRRVDNNPVCSGAVAADRMARTDVSGLVAALSSSFERRAAVRETVLW